MHFRLFEYYVNMLVYVDLSLLPTRGPCSKYELDIAEGKFKGKLELTYESDPLRVSVSRLYESEIINFNGIPYSGKVW